LIIRMVIHAKMQITYTCEPIAIIHREKPSTYLNHNLLNKNDPFVEHMCIVHYEHDL
jgi:hypothetical protein